MSRLHVFRASALAVMLAATSAGPAGADAFPTESAASRTIHVPKDKSLSFRLDGTGRVWTMGTFTNTNTAQDLVINRWSTSGVLETATVIGGKGTDTGRFFLSGADTPVVVANHSWSFDQRLIIFAD